MRTGFVFCVMLFAAGAARGEDVVRAELAAALEGRSAPSGPQAELREYVALLSVAEKPKAKARLDRFDLSTLAPADLRNLSEAYVLLGYYDAGAGAGRALQDRDPSGTQGLKLAAMAKLEGKDYGSAVALAREALKINPKDKDAAGILYTATGRGAASASSPSAVIRTALSPSEMTQIKAASSAPSIFTPRLTAGPRSPVVPFPGSERTGDNPDGPIKRAAIWVNRKIDEATAYTVKLIDRKTGIRPGEEKIVEMGVKMGATAGAAVGLIGGGILGGVACSPALETGVPYLGCVLAGGAGGLLVMTPLTGYAGGVVFVKAKRGKAIFDKNFGFGSEDDSPKAE